MRHAAAAALAATVSAAACLATLLAQPAAADQQSGLQGQADQIAGQIAGQAARIHTLDVQLAAAQQQQQAADRQMAAAQASAGILRQQIATSRAALHTQAVADFMIGRSAGDLSVAMLGSPDKLFLREEYLRVAGWHETSTIDRLHLEQQTLAEREAQITAADRQAHAAVDALSRDRQAAMSVAAGEGAALARVKGALATLVSQAEQARLGHSTAGGAPQGQPLAGGLSRSVGPPPTGSLGGDLAALRRCESGGDYSIDTGNGFYGAYQFSQTTWAGMGQPGLPSDASPALQDQVAAQLARNGGWANWPTCSAALGL